MAPSAPSPQPAPAPVAAPAPIVIPKADDKGKKKQDELAKAQAAKTGRNASYLGTFGSEGSVA